MIEGFGRVRTVAERGIGELEALRQIAEAKCDDAAGSPSGLVVKKGAVGAGGSQQTEAAKYTGRCRGGPATSAQSADHGAEESDSQAGCDRSQEVVEERGHGGITPARRVRPTTATSRADNAADGG
ncbi:hypothetical protein WN979_16560 [Streptomyces albidoflavus]|uniref:hypothetical protein n=1 Tax=Streptomyces albidoflavus TaxID=1886 RepID=UPI003253FF86